MKFSDQQVKQNATNHMYVCSKRNDNKNVNLFILYFFGKQKRAAFIASKGIMWSCTVTIFNVLIKILQKKGMTRLKAETMMASEIFENITSRIKVILLSCSSVPLNKHCVGSHICTVSMIFAAEAN